MDYDSTPEFDDQFLKLTEKNKALEARLIMSIRMLLSMLSSEIKLHFCV